MYDISACHYQILEKMNIDISHIDKADKIKRNIQIGLMMKSNPTITNILRSITISTVDEYLLRNNVSPEDIILRQYDGVIVARTLSEDVNQNLPLDLQSIYEAFLISSDRRMYVSFDGNKVDIKGVPHRYPRMDEMIGKLIKINFLNKSSIFKSIQKIKDEIMASDDPLLYCIPVKDKFVTYVKNLGEIEISTGMARIIDTEDIDRQKYFDQYIRPFTESICIEFL